MKFSIEGSDADKATLIQTALQQFHLNINRDIASKIADVLRLEQVMVQILVGEISLVKKAEKASVPAIVENDYPFKRLATVCCEGVAGGGQWYRAIPPTKFIICCADCGVS